MSEDEMRDHKDPALSPLKSLAEFIASEHGSDEWISFPQGTEEKIKAHRSLGTKFSKAEIQKLVRALSVHGYHFCSRLDGLSLTLLCSIVTYSEPCGARYRVYYLIAEAIHPGPHDSQASIEHKYINKCALCNLLSHLLELLARGPEQEEPRRWMSVLVLELLEGCPQNIESLQSYQGKDWQGLTSVMMHCECEILRILTGSIIRQLLSGGVKSNILWTADDTTDWVKSFPVSPQEDTQWINDFEDYVGDMVKSGLTPERKSFPTIANGIVVGDHRFVIEQKSGIFVSLSSSLLKVFVRASSHDLATHINIPFANIVSYEVDSATSAHVENSLYTTQIRLSELSDAPLFINAKDRNDRDVGITFGSYQDADNLKRLIRTKTLKQATPENAARATGKASKKISRKVMEVTEDDFAIVELTQVPVMVSQNADRDYQKVDRQRKQRGLAQRVTQSSEYRDIRTIAAKVMSSLVSGEKASASTRTLVLNHTEKNDNAMQTVPDSLEFKAGIGLSLKNAKASETSQIQNRDRRSSNIGNAEGPTSLNIAPATVFEGDSRAKAGRTSNAYTEPNETKPQVSKRRKLTQQLQDAHGKVNVSGQPENHSKSHHASPKLTASKSISSKLSTKTKAVLPSRKLRFGSKDVNDENTQQIQSKKTIPAGNDPYDIPMSPADQDSFDIPMSPVHPKNSTMVNRITGPSTRKTYKVKKKSTVASSTKTQKKSFQGQKPQSQAPKLLTQPRSRRAAAIQANEKIQGMDNSTTPSPTEGTQKIAERTRAINGQSEVAQAKADTTAQHDSIETVQTPDKINPVPQIFVQDSIETVKTDDERLSGAKRGVQDLVGTAENANKTPSTKNIVPNSLRDGDKAKSSLGGHANEIGEASVVREQREHDQAKEDPQMADDANYPTLDPGEDVLDSSKEKPFEAVPLNGMPPSIGRENTQHITSDGEAKEGFLQHKYEASNVIQLTKNPPHAQETAPTEERRNEQVLDGSPLKGLDPKSTLKQRGADPGLHTQLKDAEGALTLNSPKIGQTSNNDLKMPECPGEPEVNESPVNRDPFSAKLNKVVKGKEVADESHSKRVVNARKSGDENGNSQEPPTMTQSFSLLKEGQHNVGAPGSHYLDSQTKKPAARPKRKAYGELRTFHKNPRLDTHEVDGANNKSARTPPNPSRKTAIISFSASGPRNQGTTNKKDNKKPLIQESDAKKGRLSGAVENTTDGSEGTPVAVVPLREPQKSVSQKSLLPEIGDLEPDNGYMALEDEEQIALANEEQEPLHLPDRFSQQAKVDRHDTKPSSQTTRVNYNGSPMPVRHPTNEPAPVLASNSKLKVEEHQLRQQNQGFRNTEEDLPIDADEEEFDADEEEDEVEDHEKILEPTLPSRYLVSQLSMPQIGAYNWTSIAKNSKQVPSSPHEPSVTAALPRHHIHRGGQIINANTHEPVIRSNPQDPFVAHAAMPSSFMRLLQNVSEKYNTRRPDVAVNERSKKVKISIVPSPNDPEKTMVERSFSHRRMNFDESKRVTSSKSSGNTSEEETSQTLIEERAEDTPTQWKKALLPHQENTLEVLNEISHRLLAHMVKGEDSFLDLVQDFKKSGNKLIDHLEKELEEGIVARTAATAALEKKMVGLFQSTMADLKESEDKMVGWATQVEAELNSHQESLSALTEAALALCKG